MSSSIFNFQSSELRRDSVNDALTFLNGVRLNTEKKMTHNHKDVNDSIQLICLCLFRSVFMSLHEIFLYFYSLFTLLYS